MKKPRKAAGKIPALKPTRQEFRLPHLRELSMSYEGRNETVSMRPPDISRHGMFINTGTRFPEGSVLKLRFRLAHSGIEVETRCEVQLLPGWRGNRR
jgi:PilZ domain